MTESILNRLKTESTPLVDQEKVTFIWHGRSAPALVGDFTGWDDGTPVKLDKQGKGLWTYQLSFPEDAYIEYAFKDGEESLADPNNPRVSSNGVGGFNNYFTMVKYRPTDLSKRTRRIPHGTVTGHTLPTDNLIYGDERQIHLYQPPVTDPVPLVVVWDGLEYLSRVRLNYIVDNLIAQHRITPIALAFIHNAGQDNRTSEYACNEATLLHLIAKVVPLARKELNLLDINERSGAYGVLGASMGGLMALFTGARLPHIFGKVLSQSGAFTLGTFDTVVFDFLAIEKHDSLKIWLDVGRYDLPGLLEANRRMQSVLTQNHYSLSYREYNAGHNNPAWRDEVWRGLEALYGIN